MVPPRPALLLLLLLVSLVSPSLSFQTGPCDHTPRCQCKWSEGKRMADCSNQNLQSIPATLSSEIQTLVLDGNPLRKLDKDAFKTVGLLNVQTLSLRRCRIEYLDDNAFRDLKIMTHLDLSHNNITKVFPKTFDGNDGLKTVKLSHNPVSKLVAYQFPPLRSLKALDMSHCAIDAVDKTAFKNLGGSVESVLLNDNALQTLREEVFVSLVNLKSLTLHSNPWTCDCRLKGFRDFVVNKRLYNRPTRCSEPSRLFSKYWDDISAAEFACKPEIEVPFRRVFGAPGVDATLSCRIMGSPVPQARWVVNGRIVNNNTNPKPFADQTWLIREQRLTYDGVERWYNLTITNPGLDDLGEYLCVAENNGGVMESKVWLTFDDPETYGGIPVTDEQLTVIIGVSVAVFLLLVLLVLLCCACVCRARNKKEDLEKEKRADAADSQKLLPQANGNGRQINISQSTTQLGAGGTGLANGGTLPKARSLHHQIDYHGLPQADPHNHSHGQLLGYIPADKYELEMQDLHRGHQHHHLNQHPLRAPSSVKTSNSSSAGSNNGSEGGRTTASISRASFVDDQAPGTVLAPSYPPDLLVIKPSSISPNSMHQLNPAGLIQLTPVATASTPFTRSGTLPLPHHHGNRSFSCDHSNSSSPIPHLIQGPNGLPVVHHHHHLPHATAAAAAGPGHGPNAGGRPGYVTLPRRPRASWSVPREQPSPSASLREPIYDGIGPRTSADGSSRLNLNKTPQPGQPQQQQPQTTPRGFALPPYYAPIEELSECPPTPKQQQSKMQNGLPKSTPNILDLKPEKQKQQPSKQQQQKQHKPSKNGSMGNNTTSSSETTLLEENISAYCEPFGKALVPSKASDDSGASSAGNRNSVTSAESELEAVVPPQPQPPQPAKKPPKTLPKPPKVKPVPPPKPKKSFQENGATPLIAFQDESVDGSEV